MKNQLHFYLLALLLIHSPPSSAQKNLTANEAADSVQQLRNSARQLYENPHASKREIEQGIHILNGAVHFIDSLSDKGLGEPSFYFKFRKSDAVRELVYAYALNHQNDEAIAALSEHFKEGTDFFILDMVKDSVFNQLNQDPRFIAVLNKYKARTALWDGAAFQPAGNELTEAEKIAGLSLLWSQARENFVYFDHLTADWNQTYLDFIPQVQAAKTRLDYYRVLQRFYAQLHDGHTNVYLPKDISAQVNSRPPLKTSLIEGRVFITLVLNDSLQKTGIVPGMEVMKVDGTPVKEYAETYVKPYQSSATPQDLAMRMYTYYLLAGAASKPVTLELRDRKGRIWSASIARSGYPAVKPAPALVYREIGNIGYLVINNFEDYKIIKQYDSLFTSIAKTKALVIDIRNNGGGDSGIGDHILATLTDKPFELFAYKHLLYSALLNPPDIGGPVWENDGIAMDDPDGKRFYNKPVVLLVNAATFSAAEDFAVAFDYMKRGPLIGQPTGGSTGQPLRFNLPGGGTARVCSKRETYPDGKEFVGIGIIPTLIIQPTIKDLYNGTDTVLAKALDTLK